LQAAADVNALDSVGHSPLFDAKAGGFSKCAELLVEAGCIGSGGSMVTTASAAPPRVLRSAIRSAPQTPDGRGGASLRQTPAEAERKRRSMPATPAAVSSTMPSIGAFAPSPAPALPPGDDFFANLTAIVSPQRQTQQATAVTAEHELSNTLDFFHSGTTPDVDLDRLPNSLV